MLLTISTTYNPATDIGYLLMKNPQRVHTFSLAFGRAHVVYPEASEERCTAALLLDVDPVGLVRRRGNDALADGYVNDRPYVASSFMSVALAEAFGTAMGGRSRERPELAGTPLPLGATLSAVAARGGGDELLRKLWEPLGYAVEAIEQPLDERFPEWGRSNLWRLELSGTQRLADLLAHLYVLLPVLDADKHYWFGEDELTKLLRRGEGWLAGHPERELITRRYLMRPRLVRAALARLTAEEQPHADDAVERHEAEEEAVERPISLHEQRIGTVVAALRQAGARSVLDLGCGEGKLLQALLRDRQFERLLGVDVSSRTLERANDKLRLERLSDAQRARITLAQGSLMYRDERLAGWDAAAVVEVIEHLDAPRLAAFEQVVFGAARPRTIVITTPNVEYNVRFPTLPAGRYRHADHRFEWTRAEFEAWAGHVAAEHGYAVRYVPIGPLDPEVGPPSQMAVFSRNDE